jgi:hypothetical protein
MCDTPEATDREERMEEALHRIQNWCDAYPLETFPKPDLAAIREKIGDGPMSALHAHWARHLLSGIGAKIKEALRE